MEEKRVKLGVDIGALSQELLQVNNLVEENYRKALKGQTDYNQILEKSIELLTKQAELVSKMEGPQNYVVGGNSNVGGGGSNSPIHVIVDNNPLPVEVTKGNGPIGGGGSGSGEMSVSDIRKYLILIDRVRGTISSSANNTNEAQDDETEAKENDILRAIREDLDQIWEKYSEGVTTPIPVVVTNIPLDTNNVNGGSGDSDDGTGTDNGTSSGGGGKGGGKGKGGANAFNQAAGLVQQDPNYIMAGLVGMIPYVGAGLAMIMNKLIQEAEQRDISKHRFIAATGGSAGYGSFTRIGLKDAESYEKLANYYPANVYLGRNDLLFEKGFNVSSGIIDSLLRSFREDIARQMGASVVGVDFLRGLSQEYGKGGIEWKEVRGYSEDYLKILVELNQKQLETTGETNSLINGNIIQGIASLDKKFGDPTILGRVIQGIENGLVQARSPQIEALQYYALSQANPGASLWEMQMMKENPFGMESRGYLSNFLSGLLSTGNIQDAKFNIMHTFGLSAHQTEYLVNGILEAQKRGENIQDYLESKDFGELSIKRERVTHRTNYSNLKDNRPVEEALPEILRRAGLNITVTSGYRPGAVTTNGNRSRHATHEAVDIVPAGNTTWDDIKNVIYSNPDVYNYMLANGIGLLDETSATGTTRFWHDHNRDHSHFHFGKDTNIAKNYQNAMAARGVSAPNGEGYNEYSTYEEVVEGSLSDAANMINEAAQTATSDIQRMVAEASNAMADAGDPLLELTATSINTIAGVVSAMPGFMETASGFISDFWGTLGDLVSKAGQGIVDGIVDGIGSILPWNWGGGNDTTTRTNNTNPQQGRVPN